MILFLVLFWCATAAPGVLRQIPGSAHLTGIKFAFGRQRELARKRLISRLVFGAETVLFGQNQENSRFDG